MYYVYLVKIKYELIIHLFKKNFFFKLKILYLFIIISTLESL